MLKVGMYGSIASPPNGELIEQRLDEISDEALLAENCGFDGIFFGEHHQDKKGFLPSPLIIAATIAGRTSRLRVGTNLLLLPLHYPVQIAEDTASLDLITHGRVVLGVGLGYQDRDMAMFGIHKSSRVGRFEESISIIRNCWSGKHFSHSGEHFNIPGIQALPRPTQRPGPPIWIGAVEPPAVRRAGRIGDGWITAPGIPIDFAKECADIYREAAAAAGRQTCVVIMRDAWVANTREEAERIYAPEVVTAYGYYFAGGQTRLFKGMATAADITFNNIDKDARLVLGTPNECVDLLHRWQEEVGADYVIVRFRQAHSGGPSHVETSRAIELFGSRVLPQLK
jgi:alkanesulfonate monooxygenase SsuD/methylene tetrahydromethanopterin reductase-like flavin-dependent oxidoreductase (luciferase family)